jgi:predicted MFS family arabinose efflux permease
VLLIETVLGVSAVLALLLVYYSRVNKIRLTASSRFHLVFVILIGLGFIFLEITFIQKFLLLLGTPIMALTVILFSILLSSGVGAYLSGRLFKKNPYKAVVISIPLLAAILLAYYVFLQDIISFSIVFQLYQRIMLTFALLSPAGLLMGFQFPSITRMASSNQDITLLWGVNVIASVIGTVLTTTSSMIIGFNGNLLVGLGLYSGALASGIAATRITQKVSGTQVIK